MTRTYDEEELRGKVAEMAMELDSKDLQIDALQRELEEWKIRWDVALDMSAQLTYRIMLLTMGGAPVDLRMDEEPTTEASEEVEEALRQQESLPFLGGHPWPC